MPKHQKPTCPPGTAEKAIFGALIVLGVLGALFLALIALIL